MINETTTSEKSAPQNWLRRTAAWIADHELWFLLLVAPLLLIPPFVQPSFGLIPALVIIAITWFARWLTYGWLAPPNPMNAPILVILLLTAIGYLIAVESYLYSQNVLSDTILRVVIFFAVVSSLRSERAILRAIAVLLIALAVFLFLYFLLTDWNHPRLINIFSIYDDLPGLLQGSNLTEEQVSRDAAESVVQGSAISNGLHPHLLGNVSSTFLPLALALFLFARGRQIRFAAAFFLLIGLISLVLSQTLHGYLGFMVALIIILLWWRPRLIFISLLFFTVVLTGLAYANRTTLATQLLDIHSFLGVGALIRLDMWSRALAIIKDMPFTGCGLSTFNIIQSQFYTSNIIGPENAPHQLFLKAALDTGIVGLIVIFWLLVALALTIWRAYKNTSSHNLQVVLVGILATSVSYIVVGMAGEIPAPVIWITWFPFGLAAAIFVFVEHETDEQSDSAFWRLVTGWRLLIPFCAIFALGLFLFPTARERNVALVQAHRALYIAIESGSLPLEQAEQATMLLTNSLDSEPDHAQLYGTRASLYAWQGDQEAALADLEQRVDLDLRDPYGTYAPFVVWQAQVDGEPLPENEKSLEHIYRRWSNRYQNRAEFHVLYAMAMERADGDPARAISRIELGLEQGAEPRALLESYSQQLQQEFSGNIIDY